MIGWLAHAALRSVWGRYLMIGLAILAGVRVWGNVRERDGRRDAAAVRNVETIKTLRRMHHAGSRVATDRVSVVRRMRDGTF